MEAQFILGVNYWPRERAAAWLGEFDASAVDGDFSLLAEYRFDVVRVFLLWEEFQPEPSAVSTRTLSHLVEIAEMAGEAELQLLPTFFTGHAMGVNWLPPWMLEGGEGDERFPVFCRGDVQKAVVRNFYAEREIWKAQKLLIREVTGALQGHPAIWGWDLGNEPSNMVRPPSNDMARAWLEEMVTELKRRDERLPVTLGLHQGDLEENRLLGPEEAAGFCDVLSMHVYPGYATWSDGPLDEKVPLFLGLVTRWLGGKDIIMGELGHSTEPPKGTLGESGREAVGEIHLASEEEMSQYLQETLELLRGHGFPGAMARSFWDYDPWLWAKIPFDERVQECFCGLFRRDGSPKPAADVVQQFPRERKESAGPPSWIDVDRTEFWASPREHLVRMYGRYREMAVPGR